MSSTTHAHDRVSDVFKALADPSRRAVLRAVLEHPRCVEEIASILRLAPATVSFHLGKLERAGLLRKERTQYYLVYFPCGDILNLTVGALLEADADRSSRDGAGAQARRMEAERSNTLKTYFRGGRLLHLPVQRRKRLIVLEDFATRFTPGRVYPEREVDAVINERADDHCTIRRLLVDEGYMQRAEGRYRLVTTRKHSFFPETGPEGVRQPAHGTDPEAQITNRTISPQAQTGNIMARPTPAPSRRKELIRAWKDAERTAGIFLIRNTVTGRIYLGSSLNMHGPINRHRFMLSHGSHIIGPMQEEWNRCGADAFTFEVLETVQRPDNDDAFDVEAALSTLEGRYIAAYDPFGPSGYNRPGRIRE